MSLTQSKDQLLITIFNHNQNDNCEKLYNQLKELAPTTIIDSGSDLSDHRKKVFTHQCENIYYSGLFNFAVKLANEGNYKNLMYLTSDITIPDPEKLILNTLNAMDDPKIGIYSAGVVGTPHFHCKKDSSNKQILVPFVEGICTCLKTEVARSVYPVDLALNRYGHGIAPLLGFVSYLNNLNVIVDQRVHIIHPPGTGYSGEDATKQKKLWLKKINFIAYLFIEAYSFIYVRVRNKFPSKVLLVLYRIYAKLARIFGISYAKKIRKQPAPTTSASTELKND